MFVGVCKLVMTASLEASISSFSELRREGVAAQNSFGLLHKTGASLWYQLFVAVKDLGFIMGFHNQFHHLYYSHEF